MENAAPCARAGLGEGVIGVYGYSDLARQRELKTGIRSALDHQTVAGTGTELYLRKPAPDVATHIPGGNNPADVATAGVAACGLPSSISGLCRGEGRMSPSDIDGRLLRLMSPMPLRREYLWIPHLSKRDLYARVLYKTISAVGTTRYLPEQYAFSSARPSLEDHARRVCTYDALKPYFCAMKRWTSWSGLFWSLYSAVMTSRYLSHCFVMVCGIARGVGGGEETLTTSRSTQGLSSYTTTMVRLLESGIGGK